jgi:hypothetical protein
MRLPITFCLLALLALLLPGRAAALDDAAIVEGAKKEGVLVFYTDDFNKNLELFRSLFGAPQS